MSTVRFKSFGIAALGLSISVFLFLNTFAQDREYVYSIHSVATLGALVACLCLYVLAQRRIALPRMDPLPLSIHGLLLLLVICSALINAAYLPSGALTGALSIVFFQLIFVSFLVSLTIATRRSPRSWLSALSKLLVFFAAIASVVAYQRILTGGALAGPFRLEGNRWPQLYGWFESPNFFVNAIAFGFLGSLYLVSKHRNRGAAISAALVLFLTLILSGSKGGIVALFAALFAFVLIFCSARVSYRTLLLMTRATGAVAVLSVVSYFALAQYLQASGYDFTYLLRSVVRLQSIETGTGRIDIWADALGLFLESSPLEILLGRGNGYFQAVVGHSPHNGHIRILVEYGLLAYSLVLLNALVVVHRTFRLVGRGYAAEALLLFSLFFYVFVRTVFNSSIISAGLLGFVPVLALFILSFNHAGYFIVVSVRKRSASTGVPYDAIRVLDADGKSLNGSLVR